MKLMKLLLTIMIVIIMVFSLAACGNAATVETETEPDLAPAFVYGDADGDGNLSILDATCIQRVLASLSAASFNKEAAMVSDGKELTIIDATMIQRKLVNLIERFPVEETAVEPTQPDPTQEPTTASTNPLLKIEANGYTFLADFEGNSSAEALKEKLKSGSITINMHDYGSFEKVGDLPFTLPRNDEQITTEPGDVILYLGNSLTIYYDVNSWNFTRVAKIRGADSTLKDKLGDGNVTVTLSLE